jgi:plasmid stability protein
MATKGVPSTRGLYRRGNGSAVVRRDETRLPPEPPSPPGRPHSCLGFFLVGVFLGYRPDTMLVPFWYDGGVAMTLRLPDELREALGVEAASSGRSVHAEILFRLRESVGQYVTRSGRVLTDADVEALADEAEVGYDVSGLSAPEGSARSQQRARVGAGAEPPAATVSPGPDGVDAERVVPSRLGCPMDTPHGVKCKVCGKVH